MSKRSGKLRKAKGNRRPIASAIVPHSSPKLTFDDLLRLSPDARAELDIAHVILLCAGDLT